ncbi:MAG: TldD/PmbA family protein [Deltaproteobacteria bacterium]|nr:MAG: TldD/PmbA family protein [Deltaproteobacteria bacterium]
MSGIQAITDGILARSKADFCEVSVAETERRWIRFANNGVTTNGDTTDHSVRVTAHFGKRSGTASGNDLSAEALDALVAKAEELALLSPEDPEAMPGLPPQTYVEVPGWQPPSGLDAMAEGVGKCLDAARSRELVTAGFVQQSSGWTAFATSTGLFGSHQSGSATLSQTVRTPDGRGSGWSNSAGERAEDLDYAGVAARAAEKAAMSVDPKPLAPGEYPVILEPACVANLAEMLIGSLSARSADEGRSWVAGEEGPKLGEKLFADGITITSDPESAQVRGFPWGGDGVPQQARTWVDKGVLQTLTRGRFWAEKTGAEVVPGPPNILMAGGEGSLEELIANTERAVLITSLWYIRAVAPQQLLYTGLTRDGVFWVEDGKIQHALPNFRWNDSPLTVFANANAMSQAVRVSPRGGNATNIVVPAVRSTFRLSSVSDAV